MSLRLVLQDRPVAYHPILAKAFGGATTALYLSQLLYWAPRTINGEWFWKTEAEMEEETGLTRREQETARKHLLTAGVVETKLTGLPAKLHYRIVWPVLTEALGQQAQIEAAKQAQIEAAKQDVQNRQTGMAESAKQVPQNRQTYYTEITTETTTERESEVASQLPAPHKKKQEKVKVLVDDPFRERMREKYPDLPVDETIDLALSHTSADKYNNQQLYVQNWLRRDFEQTKGAPNGTPRLNPVTSPRKTEVYIPTEWTLGGGESPFQKIERERLEALQRRGYGY